MTRRLVALALALASGCASPSSSATVASGTATVVELVYEARRATFRGVSSAVEQRPVRWAEVELLSSSGAVVATTQTDLEGRVSLPAGHRVASVRLVARVDTDGYAIAVTRDPLGNTPHAVELPLSGGTRLVAVDDGPVGPGGAFHLLDTLLLGEVRVREWTGSRLPPLYAHWARGETTEWSYFEGEEPAGSGRFKLTLMGGEPGLRATTDTDEHDEAVVLHELGHFVFDRLGSASSVGGQHPSGRYVDPGLAWEEGRATWFAAAILGSAAYTDTVGMEPSGGLQIHTNLEARNLPPRGLGSQESTEEVLWDLTDGGGFLPDYDSDGVSVDPKLVFVAMLELGRTPDAYPCLPTFLRRLVDVRLVSEEDIRRVLRHGSLPDALLPEVGSEPWPLPLSLGVEVTGRIDSITEPAPNGGPRLPRTGFDAVRTYRVTLPRDGALQLRLDVDGTGSESDRTDLDLELRDLHADEIEASRGVGPSEELVRRLSAGTYVVRVIDGGRDGSRARFRLRATLDP